MGITGATELSRGAAKGAAEGDFSLRGIHSVSNDFYLGSGFQVCSLEGCLQGSQKVLQASHESGSENNCRICKDQTQGAGMKALKSVFAFCPRCSVAEPRIRSEREVVCPSCGLRFFFNINFFKLHTFASQQVFCLNAIGTIVFTVNGYH